MTLDQVIVDSTDALLVHKLERLDQSLNLLLTSQTQSHDIELREDVPIADEMSSFTNTTFTTAGSPSASGKSWINQLAATILGLNVGITKTGFLLGPWGMELGWTVVELAATAQVGHPIDTQKYDGMQFKWNMNTDKQIYIGDAAKGVKGLLNLSQVTPTNAAKTFAAFTPDKIRAAINQVLSNVWVRLAYSKVSEDLLIPPEQYSLLVNTIVSSVGSQSLLAYLGTDTIAFRQNGKPLNICPIKWAIGRDVANKDRMVACMNDKKFARFSMVPLQGIPVQYRDVYQLVTYYGKLDAVEPVYPGTLSCMDGIQSRYNPLTGAFF